MNPNKNQPKQGSFDPRKGKQAGDNQGGNYEFLSKTEDSNATQEVNESANMFEGKLERFDTNILTTPTSAAMKTGLIGGGTKNITRPSL